jgi:hypothetical protein
MRANLQNWDAPLECLDRSLLHEAVYDLPDTLKKLL